ncbi:MAG: hypothetical protein QM776_12000 [Rhodocyclaceae bacterium]
MLRRILAMGGMAGLSVLDIAGLREASAAVVGGPVWLDDFLGTTIDARYQISLGGGSVKMAPSMSGGAAMLSTYTTQPGSPRMRFGGDAAGGDVDMRNWNVNRDIVYETRVFYNSTNYMQSSVGFVGQNDPSNFLEFYYSAPGENTSTWKFAITFNNTNGYFIDTGFSHPLSQWVVFRIETTRGSPPTVRFYINDELKGTYSGAEIPTMNLVPEYNCYNFFKYGQYSLVGLWVDYLYVKQARV